MHACVCAVLSCAKVWQAGLPVPVNVDFDVPANGPMAEQGAILKEAAAHEFLAKKRGMQELTFEHA